MYVESSGAPKKGGTMTDAAPVSLLDAHDITKRYPDFTLQGLSLSIAPGEVLGFIGKNGAGKSTTIRALLGLVRLDGGDASVLGVPANELSSTKAGNAAKEQIGVVFDAVALPSDFTVPWAAKLMRLAYASWDDALFNHLLQRLGLDILDAGKDVDDLSHGMGMKLSLACALAHRPRLLILDEATAGLDPMARDEVLDILREFVGMEGPDGGPVNGVLMSSHITSDLDKIADRILCIDEGRPVFEVNKDEVTDLMGIARCRAAEVEQLARAGVPGADDSGAGTGDSDAFPLFTLPRDYGFDVLVPDRFAFAEAHPEIALDRVTIDDYMAFRLKGRAAGAATDGIAPMGGV